MWYKIRVKTKILVQRYFHKGGTTMMYEYNLSSKSEIGILFEKSIIHQ